MVQLGKLALARDLEEDAHKPPAAAHSPEIQKLFQLALEGRIPRGRELKAWEPAKLNETHLAMITMRAGGFRQTAIAKAFAVSDANVSIVMNHPDAVFLISKLQAMKAHDPTAIQARLEALTEPFLGALEDVAYDDEIPAIRKASLGFRVLAMNGFGAPKKVEGTVKHEHTVRLDAGAAQVGELARALREAREVQALPVMEVATAEEAQLALAQPEVPDFEILGEGEVL
jgi:predicted XRE-type DNA-binding protein